MIENKANPELIENFEKKFGEFEKLLDGRKNANKNIRLNNLTSNILTPKHNVLNQLQIDDRMNKYETDKITLLSVLAEDKNNICDSPKFKLPEVKDPLWVLQPIGKYEPQAIHDNYENNQFNMNPEMRASDKNLDLVPKTHIQKKDCEIELSGIDLQKIQVCTKELDFGDVFKSSEQFRTFWIKNNLRTNLFVQLDTEIHELKRR